MLVEFRFGNFSSFKDEAVLNMLTAPQLDGDAELDEKNVFAVPGHANQHLLRAAGIYGANASGKSNLLNAINIMQRVVTSSTDSDFRYAVPPFVFDTTSHHKPSFFEIVFVLEKILFRYGFELIHDAKSPYVSKEWLYHTQSENEEVLFNRTDDTVHLQPSFEEGKSLLKPDNTMFKSEPLFLSLCSMVTDKASVTGRVRQYLSTNINIIYSLQEIGFRPYTLDRFKTGIFKDEIIDMMCKSDAGITGIEYVNKHDLRKAVSVPPETTSSEDEKEISQLLEQLSLFTEHTVFDSEGQVVRTIKVPMELFESAGTKKLFVLSGPLINTLKTGEVLFIDEMDAKFHPLITKGIIRLFQSEKTNPKNAQLIFITHDTNLLSKELFRRDQIWFVEKDSYGASHLYSLAEFKFEETKDSPYEEDYIAGHYGAIPFLGDFSSLFNTGERGDVQK